MSLKAEEFNADELEAPTWMDSDFFQMVLSKSVGNAGSDVAVQSFKISPATVKGDHYASVMFRAKIIYYLDGILKEKSMIIKTMPEMEGLKRDALQDSHIFETEIGMYTKILPKFEKILREIGDDTILKAPCLYYSLDPRKIIIFEDLIPEGYTVVRDRTLSFEEVKVAYSKLAKWHAISYKILQEDPSCFSENRYGIFSIKEWSDSPSVRNAIKYFIEVIQADPVLCKYAEYFEDSDLGIIDKCKESFTSFHENRIENMLYVLCHGDFHMKNIMVKYNSENGEFEDLMLLDFQMSYVGPIQNDLAYSLYMMLGPDLRPSKVDELIFEYHSVLKETLEKIGFEGKIPTLLELRHQKSEDRYFELFLMAGFLPMWMKFKDGEVDIDEMIASEDYHKTLFSNPAYLDELRKVLPIYLHNGYLENLPKNKDALE